MRRRLALRKQTLTELTPADLDRVGGAGGETDPEPTPPVYGPPTLDWCPLTGPYPTLPVRLCAGTIGTG